MNSQCPKSPVSITLWSLRRRIPTNSRGNRIWWFMVGPKAYIVHLAMGTAHTAQPPHRGALPAASYPPAREADPADGAVHYSCVSYIWSQTQKSIHRPARNYGKGSPKDPSLTQHVPRSWKRIEALIWLSHEVWPPARAAGSLGRNMAKKTPWELTQALHPGFGVTLIYTKWSCRAAPWPYLWFWAFIVSLEKSFWNAGLCIFSGQWGSENNHLCWIAVSYRLFPFTRIASITSKMNNECTTVGPRALIIRLQIAADCMPSPGSPTQCHLSVPNISLPPLLNILGSPFCPPCEPAPAPSPRRGNLPGTCSAWTHIGIFLPWSCYQAHANPMVRYGKSCCRGCKFHLSHAAAMLHLGTWLVGMVVGQWLDLMTSVVFSNLNDSMILQFTPVLLHLRYIS